MPNQNILSLFSSIARHHLLPDHDGASVVASQQELAPLSVLVEDHVLEGGRTRERLRRARHQIGKQQWPGRNKGASKRG